MYDGFTGTVVSLRRVTCLTRSAHHTYENAVRATPNPFQHLCRESSGCCSNDDGVTAYSDHAAVTAAAQSFAAALVCKITVCESSLADAERLR